LEAISGFHKLKFFLLGRWNGLDALGRGGFDFDFLGFGARCFAIDL
jgi:hypothetical protein